MTRGPAIVRLNAAEFAALSDDDPAGDAPARFAKAHATVVAVTGGVDRITDGARHAVIANGDPLMGLVTAMGCAGSALVAAALAVEADPFIAAGAALTAFGVAGEVAALDVVGPGSFAAAIIDAPLRPRSRDFAPARESVVKPVDVRLNAIIDPGARRGPRYRLTWRAASPQAEQRWCSCAIKEVRRGP